MVPVPFLDGSTVVCRGSEHAAGSAAPLRRGRRTGRSARRGAEATAAAATGGVAIGGDQGD